MQSKPLLNESFHADPWTPDTPSEDGTDLWRPSRQKEATRESYRFDSDFTDKELSIPAHLKPCPEVLPPVDLDKGLERMENKLSRIQKGKGPIKLTSRDILSRLTASRDDAPPPPGFLTAEPSVSVSLPRASAPRAAVLNLLCCCGHRGGGGVEASYTGDQGPVEVRDTIPLVLGDELMEND